RRPLMAASAEADDGASFRASPGRPRPSSGSLTAGVAAFPSVRGDAEFALGMGDFRSPAVLAFVEGPFLRGRFRLKLMAMNLGPGLATVLLEKAGTKGQEV